MYRYPRVKDLRTDKDKSQADIAKYLGEHLTTYRRWESGEREIPTHIIIELCRYYDVSADYLLGFTNEFNKLPRK